MLELIPSAEILDSTGGNIIFLISFDGIEQIKEFFNLTESNIEELPEN